MPLIESEIGIVFGERWRALHTMGKFELQTLKEWERFLFSNENNCVESQLISTDSNCFQLLSTNFHYTSNCIQLTNFHWFASFKMRLIALKRWRLEVV